MPGLGASSKIFERISLPKDTFELHFLEWKIPTSLDETIEEYALRISDDITHKNPVLLGVSFGGILVQEIAKIISVQKIICYYFFNYSFFFLRFSSKTIAW